MEPELGEIACYGRRVFATHCQCQVDRVVARIGVSVYVAGCTSRSTGEEKEVFKSFYVYYVSMCVFMLPQVYVCLTLHMFVLARYSMSTYSTSTGFCLAPAILMLAFTPAGQQRSLNCALHTVVVCDRCCYTVTGLQKLTIPSATVCFLAMLFTPIIVAEENSSETLIGQC